MNVLVDRTTRLVGGVLLLAFVASGCRTYGGYGSAEDLPGKIQQATQRFAEDYGRAQAERDALQRAATANPALDALSVRFAEVVAQQGALVEEHQRLADAAAGRGGSNFLFAWVGPDNYRWLHRIYGAIVSDQQLIRDRYAAVLRAVQQTVGGAPDQPVAEVGRYQVAPQFYKRIESAFAPRSVADALAQARPAAAPEAPDGP